MDLNELREELAQLQDSMAAWQRKRTEAQAAMAQAQQQIDVHFGHIARIEIWIVRLAEKQNP